MIASSLLCSNDVVQGVVQWYGLIGVLFCAVDLLKLQRAQLSTDLVLEQ